MDARRVVLTGNMVAVYHGRMLTESVLKDIQEWMKHLREIGQPEMRDERMRRMVNIEFKHRHYNFTGYAMAMLREEYIKDVGYLALRIYHLDEYFAQPWYKRIFSRPFIPNSK